MSLTDILNRLIYKGLCSNDCYMSALSIKIMNQHLNNRHVSKNMILFIQTAVSTLKFWYPGLHMLVKAIQTSVLWRFLAGKHSRRRCICFKLFPFSIQLYFSIVSSFKSSTDSKVSPFYSDILQNGQIC